MTAPYQCDVAIFSDFRYTGGNSASIAEEVKTQHAAGLRTLLLQLPSRRLRQARPVSPRIKALLRRGEARLLSPTVARVQATLVVFRHPLPAEAAQELPTRVEATAAVLVVNQTLYGISGAAYDVDVHASVESIRALTGLTPAIAPIGPWVRDQLPRDLEGLIHAEDWVNIVHPPEWHVPRPAPAGRPVVGRHSRDDWTKWPRDVVALESAWPPGSDWDVRILGGARTPVELLGYQPSNWTVYTFGTIEPVAFLAGLDYYVYFHHPDWLEAFGRSVLEALATGCVVVTHPEYERLFGTGALYGQPADVPGLVEQLHADPSAVEEQRQVAVQVVQDRFSDAAHLERLERLGVASCRSATSTRSGDMSATVPATPAQRWSARPERSRRGLLLSSNGAGIGHLSRTVALARRFPTTAEPVFLTLSEGIWLPQRWAFTVERMPSSKNLGTSPTRWNAWFRERIVMLAGLYGASFVVFDGTVPYVGLLEAVEELCVPWFWLRRPMWKADAPARNLQRGDSATAIIEPGDLAAEFDRGPTVRYSKATNRLTDPVLLLRSNELLSRDAARSHLSLGPSETAVLVTLGAANLTDQYDPLEDTLELLQRHPGIRIFATTSPLVSSRSVGRAASYCEMLSHYPLAELMPAFDFAVAASGYNTFHELFVAGVPAVFIPTLETEIDDQYARARYAQASGCGLCVLPGELASLREALDIMADPQHRAYFHKSLQDVQVRDGAKSAAGIVMDHLGLVESESV